MPTFRSSSQRPRPCERPLVSGFVHHVVTQRHRSREFIGFLEPLDAHYRDGMLICLLLDNHSAHCSRETKRFLANKPGRFELVFTPTHSSWLNYVETFFSKVARSVLRRIRVREQGGTGRSHPPLHGGLQRHAGTAHLVYIHPAPSASAKHSL
ncbi:MAG: transposase [Acetobacteraceae bacterium]|nr:transposase [Acetobacteraceae bacterium]